MSDRYGLVVAETPPAIVRERFESLAGDDHVLVVDTTRHPRQADDACENTNRVILTVVADLERHGVSVTDVREVPADAPAGPRRRQAEALARVLRQQAVVRARRASGPDRR